ncbi:hypothetical protein L1887_01376 [Cichorium endivia]|nr:hypothetical protein L1887_01376 [Cichorium endivia]
MGRRRQRIAVEDHPPHNNVTTEMSSDIILFHILPRLPVKSLRRFQCVSKQWHSFLTTPEFSKMQLHHVITNQDHHKLLVLSNTAPYKRIIDCENPEKKTAQSPLPFKGISLVRSKSILTSFHGMVCIAIENRLYAFEVAYFDLIIWNPSTGEYKTLSKAHYHKEIYHINGGTFGLYYSSSDDDYKLLRISRHPNVYIYSLKSDSWRKVELTETFRPLYHRFSCNSKPSVLLNEKLYFLEQTGRDGNLTPCLYLLIRFDINTEKFTEIVTPFSGNTTIDSLSIMVQGGCIHLFATISQHAELWRMDGDEVWTKVETSFSSSQKPLHLMRNGKWIVHSDCGNVYQVNMKTHYRRKLYSLRKSDDDIVLEDYMETIVSPNQYMK